MRIRTLVTRTVVVAVAAAASGAGAGAAAGTAQAAGGHGRVVSLAAGCATVKVKARPSVNTAMIPETIKSTVTNCSPATETVTLTQKIAGPFRAQAPVVKRWTITLSGGQTVTKTRSVPYTCCGSYNVYDKVYSASGQQLAKSAASFTFA